MPKTQRKTEFVKKHLLILIIIGFSSSSSAEDMTTQEVNEYCRQVHEAAVQVMEARQENMAIHDVMERAEEMPMGRGLVIDAYNIPLIEDPQEKALKTKEFADEITLLCYQAM